MVGRENINQWDFEFFRLTGNTLTSLDFEMIWEGKSGKTLTKLTVGKGGLINWWDFEFFGEIGNTLTNLDFGRERGKEG